MPPPHPAAVEESPLPPDRTGMSAGRAYCALRLLEPWTEALLVWQRVLPRRMSKGFGSGPGWYAARLREIASGILHAADVIEGIERRDG